MSRPKKVLVADELFQHPDDEDVCGYGSNITFTFKMLAERIIQNNESCLKRQSKEDIPTVSPSIPIMVESYDNLASCITSYCSTVIMKIVDTPKMLNSISSSLIVSRLNKPKKIYLELILLGRSKYSD
ncbi:hypothetical protein OROGR_011147 [Orobanche gracilis]